MIIIFLTCAWPVLAAAQAAPEAPGSVQAVSVANSQAVTVSWAASATAGVTYRVYRSGSGGITGSAVVSDLAVLSYADTNVTFGNTYYYRVAAVSSDVESQLSTQVSAKVELPVPVNIQATDTRQGGEIKITWDRPTLGLLLKYAVHRSTTSGVAGYSVSGSVEGTEYIDKGVTNGIYYYYQVASVYTTGQISPLSAVAVGMASDAAPPEKITGLSGSSYEAGKVSLSWSAPRNEQSNVRYLVYRSSSATDLGTLVAEIASTSYSESALNPGQVLFYSIVAKDASNNISIASDPARVVVATASTASRTQYKVSDMAAEGTLNRGEIQLRWKLPSYSDITYARVYRRLSGAESSAMIADKVYGSSYLDKGVEVGKNYYYIIRLVDKSGYEYEAGPEKNATSFTEKSTSASPAAANKTPAPSPAAKPKTPAAPAKSKTYAYNRPRMTNLRLEAALANDLRRFLIKQLGAKKVPRRINPVLIRAYIYGGYSIAEIAHTIINGPGLVHPSIRAVDWRKSQEYQKHKKK